MINLIWDFDGTIVNSYETIVQSIKETLEYFGVPFEWGAVESYILAYSTREFLEKVCQEYNIEIEECSKFYTQSINKRTKEIKLQPHVKLVLQKLIQQNASNYIYTHRGSTTDTILCCNQINYFFKEVVDSTYHYARKPNPEAIIYLVEKYMMNKESTFYIGDRKIDVQCAHNAGIKSILYRTEVGDDKKFGADYVITDLIQIMSILECYS